MERVIQNLQHENAELRKKAVSNIKYVELTKEVKELKKALDDAKIREAEITSKLSAATEQADRASTAVRELAEARRGLKAGHERSQALRAKLLETHSSCADEALCSNSQDARLPQLALVHAELEVQLKAARSEARALRDELVSKGSLVVDVGSQLSEALEAAAAAQQRLSTLEEQMVAQRELNELLRRTERERDDAAAESSKKHIEIEQLQRRVASLEQQLAAAGTLAAQPAAPESAGLVAVVGVENAALREQNASLTAELAALSPQFFDEIEDLKYAHAIARDMVERYQQVYGELE